MKLLWPVLQLRATGQKSRFLWWYCCWNAASGGDPCRSWPAVAYWTRVMYKQSPRDALRAKVIKHQANGRCDVQYQTVEGQAAVPLSVPRDWLAFI